MPDLPNPPGDLVFPDYRQSIVNLSCSILAAFGAEAPHSPLGQLDLGELSAKRTIVLLVCDGLGNHTVDLLARDRAAFLASKRISTLTSVYPSTTTAAIPSLMSARTPAEHGCLGWSLYFKEYGGFIDYLPFRDHVDGAAYSREGFGVAELMGTTSIFEPIAARGVDTRYLIPRSLHRGEYAAESSRPARRHPYRSLRSMFRTLERLVRRGPRRSPRRFIFAYYNEPDHTMHHRGCAHEDTAEKIAEIDRRLERIARRLAGTEATLFVTADHGLVDTDRIITVNEDPELYETLVLPTFPERRFISFFVKPHRRQQFERAMEKYRGDFLLMPREEFLERGLLGPGVRHAKIDDFVGDYVALATGTAQMTTAFTRPDSTPHELIGHHAGLRREEMVVPLVRIDP